MSLIDFDVYSPGPGIVKSSGPKSANIVIVGEAPGKEELKQGAPLVGPTGQVLNEYIHNIKVLRRDVYLCNVFRFAVNKIRKPKEKMFYKNNLVWSAQSGFTPLGRESVDELMLELSDLNPNVIVPLGNVALDAFFGLRSITKYRGSCLWHEQLGCKVIPTFHPASVFHLHENKFLLYNDFSRVRDEMFTKELNPTPRQYIIFPDFAQVCAYLQDVIDNKRQPFSFDLETKGNQVTHFGCGLNATTAMSIVFYAGGKDIYDLEQELYIWNLLTQILEDESIKKEGQNLTYDIGFLYKRYGILTKNFDDTMIGFKTAYPGLRMGLDMITSIYTDLPYYKDEGKQHTQVKDEALYATYNAKDVAVVSEAMPQIKVDLERQNNYTTYEIQKSLVPILLYMGQRGIRVDEDAFKKIDAEVNKQAEELQQELNDLAGFDLNTRSNPQLIDYFYTQKGIKPYYNNGSATVNEKALRQLAAGTSTRKGLREAELVLEIRKLRNTSSKEFDLDFENGRLTTAYRPVTSTGRLSSTADVFGAGTNVQNRQGKIVNKYFLADEGYIIFSADYSQADNRSVAYMAPEPRMIEAFETGIDVHSYTAGLVFDIDPAEIKRQDKDKILCDIGNGDKTYRAWGKMLNHALNFGMGINKFSLNIGVDRQLGKQLYNSYHSIYPGVQNGYQRWVRETLYGRNELPVRQLTNCFGRVWYYLGSLTDLTEAYAFPAQSNTADAINRFGLIPLYYDDRFAQVDLLRQVHDSIDFQIPKSIGINAMADLLRKVKSSFETPIHWKGRDFILPIDMKAGHSLDPMTKLNFNNLESQLEDLFQ